MKHIKINNQINIKEHKKCKIKMFLYHNLKHLTKIINLKNKIIIWKILKIVLTLINKNNNRI